MGNCAGQKRPNPKPQEQPAQLEQPPLIEEQRHDLPPGETHQNLPQERQSPLQEKQQDNQQSQRHSDQKPQAQPIPEDIHNEEQKQEDQAAAKPFEEKVEVPVKQDSPPQLIQVPDDEIDVFEEAINPPKKTVNFFQVGYEVLKVLNSKDNRKSPLQVEQFKQQMPQIIIERTPEEYQRLQQEIKQQENQVDQKNKDVDKMIDELQNEMGDLSPVNIPMGEYILVESDKKLVIEKSPKKEDIDQKIEGLVERDRQVIVGEVQREVLQ